MSLIAYLTSVDPVDKEELRRVFSLKLYKVGETIDPVSIYKMDRDEILGPNPKECNQS